MKTNHFMRSLLIFAGLFVLTVSSVTALGADARWTGTTSRDESNNICVDFPDIQIVLPAGWSGKVQMNLTENGANFYHIASHEKLAETAGDEYGGFLFGIFFSENPDDAEYEENVIIGETAEGVYFAKFPTEEKAYTDDPDIEAEYEALRDDMEWIKANLALTSDTAASTADSEYIFPESSDSYLSERDLFGMSDREAQMAINEIYARHHRKFASSDVQAYFDSKSWYSGTIEPSQFDSSVFNSFENANIQLLLRYIDNYSDPYSSFNFSGDYIFPQSDTEYLTERDLSDKDVLTLEMAVNEIYARHHCKFSIPGVQAYFDSKSWYSGSIEWEQFDEAALLNDFESENINRLMTRIEDIS